MQVKNTLIVAALLSALGASSAFAVEATQDFANLPASTRSRADVQAEALAAMRAGTLSRNEASYTVEMPATSTKTRAQVVAELREASRLGLVATHEGEVRFPTAAENEQIRQAGLRALDSDVQLAGK